MIAVPNPEEFDFEGSYSLDGNIGLQVGRVSYIDDGIFYGSVRDSNDGMVENLGDGKFLLGLHFPERDEIAFLKWSYSPVLSPVFWWMSSVGDHCKDGGLAGSYDGFYAFASNHFSAMAIQNQMEEKLGDIPRLDAIRRIGFGDLADIFFNEAARDVVYRSGEDFGQHGSVSFDKVGKGNERKRG